MTSPEGSQQSRRALEWTNFFVADVQTGIGPFLAAYLAGAGWTEDHVGYALTLGGVVTVLLQTPAGAIVDRVRGKRAVVVVACVALALAALLPAASTRAALVSAAQVVIGAVGAFIGPTLAAITMGLAGAAGFDRQFGRNQSFNSAGNLMAAGLIAGVSLWLGTRAIFPAAAALAVPAIIAVLMIRGGEIDYERARGGCGGNLQPGRQEADQGAGLRELLSDPVLRVFLPCCFLFHLANAAMLPQLGEMLAHGRPRQAAPFMSACVAVTQLVIMLTAVWIGRAANARGRKWLLMLGFGVLPVRAVLYTVVRATAGLIAVQLLDGVANAIFGVVAVLMIADRSRGTGHFNLAQGAMATAVGMGAALSNSVGGWIVRHHGYSVSFLCLGAIALVATALLGVGVPETKVAEPQIAAG